MEKPKLDGILHASLGGLVIHFSQPDLNFV
jgi:hypothetical protein